MRKVLLTPLHITYNSFYTFSPPDHSGGFYFCF